MFFLRKIGAILRGKATPFQLFTGCLLGALIGFMPGFGHAPGLVVTLSLLLVLLNANLLLAALVGLAAKLLSLALLPVSFALGRLLLDGPTGGLFAALINAPVFALFGFENYTATGGLVLGTLTGSAAGLLLVKLVNSFRRKMQQLGTDSARYKAVMGKGWVRFLVFVLVGGGLKDPDYAALLTKKVGNPIRPLGAVLVGLTLVLLVVTYQFFAATIVTTALQTGLEKANGATVDLERAELDLSSGRMTLSGLAVADPNALATDLFRASTLTADVSGVNLLRKRLQLDNVEIVGASTGEPRRVPGRRLPSATEPTKPVLIPDAKTLEDYLNNAKIWKERLAQLKGWLDKLHGSEPIDDSVAGDPAEESLGDRLEREAAARGYRAITADHLVTGAPTLLVTRLHAGEVRAAQVPGETLDVTAENLSTQPRLVAAAPSITITSSRDTLGFEARLGGASAAAATSSLAFHYRGIPVDEVAGSLANDGGTPPLAGGTLDLAGSGAYHPGPGTIELPLEITLHDTTVSVGGRQTRLSRFVLPVGVAGPLDAPRLNIDQNQLGKIAASAGKAILEEKARDALGEKAGGLLEGFLGGKKKNDPAPSPNP